MSMPKTDKQLVREVFGEGIEAEVGYSLAGNRCVLLVGFDNRLLNGRFIGRLARDAWAAGRRAAEETLARK